MRQFTIHPDTTVGKVILTVSELPAMTRFYKEVIGLTLKEQTAERAILGTPNETIVELYGNPNAQQVEPSTGLYHMAILVPDRPSLAHWLYQFLSNGYRLPGASDHGVSEALYLNDPEGNGIEIYRDRPRSEWPMQDGQIQMVTERLDFEGLMKEVPPTPWQKMPDETTMGHVHLKVHNIPESVAFYSDVVGFDITSDEYPGAGFVSAGGYHHHLGMNTWHSAGAQPLPPGAAGLAGYSIQLPNETARDQVVENIQNAGYGVEETADGPLVRDPAGINFVLDVR
ncbi:MAG: VOC family protein [Candidatus Promineifilaceae bacterium]